MPQEHDRIEHLPEARAPHNREMVQRYNPETQEYEWVTVVHDWHDETPSAGLGQPPLFRGEDLPRPYER